MKMNYIFPGRGLNLTKQNEMCLNWTLRKNAFKFKDFHEEWMIKMILICN